MIQLFQVQKSYDNGNVILNDLNLHIEKGEFVCLSGDSGAGKSTLLKMIFCQDFPNSGQVIIDGRNIFRITRKNIARLRRHMGVVFQDYKLIQSYTVFENIALRLRILGENKRNIKDKVFEILSMVDLHEEASKKPKQLSGGEQQRVAIARALVNQPKILLADEPTGNLDQNRAVEIMNLLRKANRQGTTVLMVTHNPLLLAHQAQRHIQLIDGKIVEQ